ncbi:hypothetical protein JCM11491_003578 [Sporobolomyces phaffii]
MRPQRAARITYKEASDSEESSGDESGPPRKKAIAKGKTNKKYEEEASSDSDDDISAKRKNRKSKSKSKGKGNKGRGPIKHNPMNVLPVELFYEILAFLSPKDLLALSRTNKEYRATLMSKARSERIWKQSFKAVGLPELAADDWSLPACADLVFSQHCYECGRYAPSWMDPWLRRRICQACRKSALISPFGSYYVTTNNLHPRLDACVAPSYILNDGHHWRYSQKNFAHPEDLEKTQAILQELQALDQVEIDAGSVQFTTLERSVRPQLSNWHNQESVRHRISQKRPAKPAPLVTGTRSRSSAANKSYVEASSDDDDEENDIELCQIGPRVSEFVAERQRIILIADQDAHNLYRDADKIVALVRDGDKWNADRLRLQRDLETAATQATARRLEIEKRLNETAGYEGKDLQLLTEKSLKPFLGVDALTGEAWKRLQPKLFRLIDSAKKKRALKDAEFDAFGAEVDRKNSLRKFYNKLLEDVAAQSHFSPLFDDFLYLPSVQELWKRRDSNDLRRVVTGIEWIMKREIVLADLEEYHLDFVGRAVGLVLSTTREYEDEGALEDAIEATLAGNLDAFFDEATSMVFCDGGCETVTRLTYSGWRFPCLRRQVQKKKVAFFGTFPQVVAHQLVEHNSYFAKHEQTRPEKRHYGVQFRFSLPLEVASAMSDLVNFLTFEDPVTADRLDCLNKGKLKMPRMGPRVHFKSWKALIDRVYVVARKAARARPPIAVEPPEIHFKPPRVWPPVDEPSEDDESSEEEESSDEDDSSQDSVAGGGGGGRFKSLGRTRVKIEIDAESSDYHSNNSESWLFGVKSEAFTDDEEEA